MKKYFNPVKIIFGQNKFKKIAELLKNKKYILITHKNITPYSPNELINSNNTKDDDSEVFTINYDLTLSVSRFKTKLKEIIMAHMVETMAYAGLTPWHGLGVNVEDNLMSIIEIVEDDKSKHQILLENLLNEFDITHVRKSKSIILSGGNLII